MIKETHYGINTFIQVRRKTHINLLSNLVSRRSILPRRSSALQTWFSGGLVGGTSTPRRMPMRLLRLSAICAILTVAHAARDSSGVTIETPYCKDVNFAVDQLVSTINTANKGKVRNLTVTGALENLSFMWIDVTLESENSTTLNGSLRNFDRLNRSSATTDCSLPIFDSVEGKFTVGPLVWTFPNIKSSFLFLESVGTIVQKAELIVDIVVITGTVGCHLESYKLLEIKNLEYEYEADSSWSGWILEWVVPRALNRMNDKQLISPTLKDIIKTLSESFSNEWCQHYKPKKSG
ncbi:hypothetical protein GE061_014137 [Apolygus lucorum]|uniref:Uncharacterized protein n=1 Tax=Apolygus lucorum TaxID=248454 RepID=A0A8S9XQX0_APOLU|nr:hypothetical protein GE061_014137 [Apolygus lucorum]